MIALIFTTIFVFMVMLVALLTKKILYVDEHVVSIQNQIKDIR